MASTVTALAVGGIAFAAIPSSTGVITGCYDNKTGALRIIDTAKTRCGTGSHTLKWNQQGAPGVTGAQGPPGEAGAPGPAGVAASGVRTIDIRQATTVGTGGTVNYSTPIDLHDCRDVTSVAIAATSVGPSGFQISVMSTFGGNVSGLTSFSAIALTAFPNGYVGTRFGAYQPTGSGQITIFNGGSSASTVSEVWLTCVLS